jgi:hypothetical protein
VKNPIVELEKPSVTFQDKNIQTVLILVILLLCIVILVLFYKLNVPLAEHDGAPQSGDASKKHLLEIFTAWFHTFETKDFVTYGLGIPSFLVVAVLLLKIIQFVYMKSETIRRGFSQFKRGGDFLIQQAAAAVHNVNQAFEAAIIEFQRKVNTTSLVMISLLAPFIFLIESLNGTIRVFKWGTLTIINIPIHIWNYLTESEVELISWPSIMSIPEATPSIVEQATVTQEQTNSAPETLIERVEQDERDHQVAQARAQEAEAERAETQSQAVAHTLPNVPIGVPSNFAPSALNPMREVEDPIYTGVQQRDVAAPGVDCSLREEDVTEQDLERFRKAQALAEAPSTSIAPQSQEEESPETDLKRARAERYQRVVDAADAQRRREKRATDEQLVETQNKLDKDTEEVFNRTINLKRKSTHTFDEYLRKKPDTE